MQVVGFLSLQVKKESYPQIPVDNMPRPGDVKMWITPRLGRVHNFSWPTVLIHSTFRTIVWARIVS